MKCEVNVSGIKCDNPNCDYVDPNVSVDQYPQYVNRPCPKCGANLLTEQDYQVVQILLKAQRVLSKIPFGNKGKTSQFRIQTNGTGAINVEQVGDEVNQRQR